MSLCKKRESATATQLGYTLLEAMIVVSIIGTMACLTVGAFQRIREQSASESLLRVLEGLLGEARARAVASYSHVGIHFFERGGLETSL